MGLGNDPSMAAAQVERAVWFCDTGAAEIIEAREKAVTASLVIFATILMWVLLSGLMIDALGALGVSRDGGFISLFPDP